MQALFWEVEAQMSSNLDPIDGLVSDIVGTANFISKILFSRNSVVAAATVSFIVFVLAWAL
jgi:hypothetical protein